MTEPEINPQEDYVQAAAMLQRMMTGRDQHVSQVEGCTAEPLCIGPVGLVELRQMMMESRWSVATLVITAVGELCRLRDERDEALAWKRDIVAQLERSGEAHEQEIRESRAQIRSLTELVGELQRGSRQ